MSVTHISNVRLRLCARRASACEQHIRASADLARGESELAIAMREVSTASTQIAGAEADQLRDRTARAEIAPLAELADEAVSPEAVHLRSLLAPNSACPVCGSTDHPHLAHPSALNEMVATVRRRREELDTAMAATSQRLGHRHARARRCRDAPSRSKPWNRCRAQPSFGCRGRLHRTETYIERSLLESGSGGQCSPRARRPRCVRTGGAYLGREGGQDRYCLSPCRCPASSDGDRWLAAGV